MFLRFPAGPVGKDACNAGDLGSIPALGRSPEGGHGGNPLLPGESPWTGESGGLQVHGGCKELDMTEQLSTAQHISCCNSCAYIKFL